MELVDTNRHYARDPTLKLEDVKRVLDWTKNQYHLPEISEIQAILFLQKSKYDIESAQKAVDAYFTFKTTASDVFLGRNLENELFQRTFNALIYTTLPAQTPEGYTVFYAKALDPNPDNYHVISCVKYIDMVLTSHLYHQGKSAGFVWLVDLKDVPYGFVKSIDHEVFKKFLHYVQKVIPWEFKGVHLLTEIPFVDEVVNLVATCKEETTNLYVHTNLDELAKHIPKSCLPSDRGGSAETIKTLHENIKEKIIRSANIFHREDKQVVDESKRFGKSLNGSAKQTIF